MSASSNIEEVSAILGQHLLAGWTMSAEACNNEGCVGCPIMTKGNESFCARCDKLPKMSEHSSRKSKAGLEQESSQTLNQGRMTPESNSSLSLDSVSTPPTPSSQLPTGPDAAPTPPPTLQLPQPSQCELQRRAQSDRASMAISEKMLQGWKLLAQECPNPTCHGVPLLKPPKARSEAAPPASVSDASTIMDELPASGRMRSTSKRSKFTSGSSQGVPPLQDPRMLCVSCGSRYLNQADVAAYDAFEAQQKAIQNAQAGSSKRTAAAASVEDASPSRDQAKEASHVDEPAAKRQHASNNAEELRQLEPKAAMPSAATNSATVPRQQPTSAAASSDLGLTLQSSLEASLRNLNQYLVELSSVSPRPGQPMPLVEITQTAQAITSLSHALKEARTL